MGLGRIAASHRRGTVQPFTWGCRIGGWLQALPKVGGILRGPQPYPSGGLVFVCSVFAPSSPRSLHPCLQTEFGRLG